LAQRILIVEDDPNLRVVIRMVLEQVGYEVAEARHGVAALESIENDPPDLVIADMRMPMMDGVELMDRIRTNPETAAMPIVLLSGLQVDAAAERLATAVVAKPFEPSYLLASIARSLQAGGG
jgi:CheY-like chemotaxis protein